jgi:hypothetical protein
MSIFLRGWLRRYATSQKVARPSPDEVTEFFFFQFTQSFQPQYGPGVYSTSNRNEYQNIFLRGKARTASQADNITAVYQPTV